MKVEQIIQILNEAYDEEYLLKDLNRMCQHYGRHSQKHSNITTNALLRRYPDFRYCGQMYRILYITGEVFIKFRSNKDVINHIKTHNYDFNGKHVYSFCKSPTDLIDFKMYLIDDEYYAPKKLTDITVAVYIKQFGDALDVSKALKVYEEKEIEPYPRGLHMAASVEEVISPLYNQTIKIIGYELNGIMDKYVGEDGENGEALYNPAVSRFETFQFKELIHVLDQQIKGVEDHKVKRLPPTPHKTTGSVIFQSMNDDFDERVW